MRQLLMPGHQLNNHRQGKARQTENKSTGYGKGILRTQGDQQERHRRDKEDNQPDQARNEYRLSQKTHLDLAACDREQ